MSPRKQVDRWNRAVSVGDEVIVTRDDGRQWRTTTRGPAYVLGGHTAVVLLAGLTGAYRLDRVRPAAQPQQEMPL